MSAEPSRTLNTRPHAYDPLANPELFEGVLARRIVALVIDVLIIGLPILAAKIAIFLFGVLTLGLGFILFWPLPAFAVVWALLYYGFTLGGASSATIGMRAMGIE